MLDISAETRLLTLQQLDQKKDDMFRWFAKPAQAMLKGQAEHPKETPNLAIALGFAFWYLGFAVREHRLSEHAYQVFVEDVIGMLRGQSQSERRSNRLGGVLFPAR